MCTAILNHVRSLHGKLAPKPRPKTAPHLSNMTSTLGAAIGTSAAAVNHKLLHQPKVAAAAPVSSQPPTGPNKAAKASMAENHGGLAPRNSAFSNISLSKQAPTPNIQVR